MGEFPRPSPARSGRGVGAAALCPALPAIGQLELPGRRLGSAETRASPAWNRTRLRVQGQRAGDGAGNLFDAFVPHSLVGWEPRFGEAVWSALIDAERALSRAQAVGAAVLWAHDPISRGACG